MTDGVGAKPRWKPVRDPVDFLVFGAPAIEEAEIAEVVDSMRASWIGTGPKVAAFEESFALYKRATNAVAVNSCTAALHLALLASGVGAGDEVITSALTFSATVNAIIHSGATPVLADVDPATQNIDPDDVARRITERTRVVLPVHFAGRPCDMTRLQDLAALHGLEIIEDCAHAVEAEYHGKPVGSFGRFGCFSFYATKNLTTGEGGMILARERADADRLKILALHGMSKDAWRRFGDDGYKHYQVVEAGFKYNMMDLQAAIGIHQLERLERAWARRDEVWQTYSTELADMGLWLPPLPEPDTRHARHLFTIHVDEGTAGTTRDEFLEAMTREGIGVGVHYLSIPEFSYYQERFGWRPEDFPNAARIGRQTVSLPLSPKLSAHDVEDVIEAVRRVLGKRVA